MFETFLSLFEQSWVVTEYVAIAMKMINFIANGLEGYSHDSFIFFLLNSTNVIALKPE
jgi:hypothetical protein